MKIEKWNWSQESNEENVSVFKTKEHHEKPYEPSRSVIEEEKGEERLSSERECNTVIKYCPNYLSLFFKIIFILSLEK